MVAPSPHYLKTTEQVLQMFPEAIRPTKPKLEEAAVECGAYTNAFGKKGFTESDIEELFEFLRAKPKSADLLAKLGPGRLYGATYPANTPGYMVFIGDQLAEDETVFIGFAPDKGAGDLLRLVQFGNPGSLAILHFFPATPADVTAHRAQLKQWQYRTDDTNWYMRSKPVNEYIVKLRDDLYGARADETDDQGE